MIKLELGKSTRCLNHPNVQEPHPHSLGACPSYHVGRPNSPLLLAACLQAASINANPREKHDHLIRRRTLYLMLPSCLISCLMRKSCIAVGLLQEATIDARCACSAVSIVAMQALNACAAIIEDSTIRTRFYAEPVPENTYNLPPDNRPGIGSMIDHLKILTRQVLGQHGAASKKLSCKNLR